MGQPKTYTKHVSAAALDDTEAVIGTVQSGVHFTTKRVEINMGVDADFSLFIQIRAGKIPFVPETGWLRGNNTKHVSQTKRKIGPNTLLIARYKNTHATEARTAEILIDGEEE